MSEPTFNWRIDAQRCYEVAIAAKREQAIRAGTIAPQTPQEARWLAEGHVPPPRLHAGKQPAHDAPDSTQSAGGHVDD